MTTVDFELKANLIILDAHINGHPARLVLDTGAGATLLGTALAERVGLEEVQKLSAQGAGGEFSMSMVRVDSLAVGDVEVRDLTCMVGDIGGINDRLGGGIAGVVGYDFLSRSTIAIDYRARQVTFEPYASDADGDRFTLDGDRYVHHGWKVQLDRPDASWSFVTDNPLPAMLVVVERGDVKVTLQARELQGLALDDLLPSLESSLTMQVGDYTELARTSFTLDGVSALRIDYRGITDDGERRCFCVALTRDGHFFTLIGAAPVDGWSEVETPLEAIARTLHLRNK